MVANSIASYVVPWFTKMNRCLPHCLRTGPHTGDSFTEQEFILSTASAVAIEKENEADSPCKILLCVSLLP